MRHFELNVTLMQTKIVIILRVEGNLFNLSQDKVLLSKIEIDSPK